MGHAPALEADQGEVEMTTMAGNTYWQGKGNYISFSTGKYPVVAGDAFERHDGGTGEEDKGQK